MSSLTTGSPLVTCRTRRGFNRQSGSYVEYQYEGPRESIYGMTGELTAADNWELDHDGSKYSLKVRYASAQDENVETPVDEVRLHANRGTVSIYNAVCFTTLPNKIKTTIRYVVQNNEPLLVSDIEPDSETEDQVTLAFELYDLLLLDVCHVPINQPVLVRSRIASATYNFSSTPTPFQNIGRIISYGSIVGDAALGGTLLNTLLPSDANVGTKLIFGWLKHYPEYSQSAGNKAVLSQEYEYGRWPLIVFGAAI